MKTPTETAFWIEKSASRFSLAAERFQSVAGVETLHRFLVLRYEPDGSVTNLASHYDGKPLNSPNDLCFDVNGRIYFTDPRYGDRSDIVQDCMAVYRIELDGTLTRVIDDLQTPRPRVPRSAGG